MKWNELEPCVQQIRDNLLDIYKNINNCESDLLPDKTAEIVQAGNLIANEMFEVVVCGEVKKGKSSFINAIIGEDILPTNTKVATSQVFRIVNSEEKSFSLVFTDGSTQDITEEELTTYGSQVEIDINGEMVFERTLDYIQVNYPIKFLPKNIAIVDTPGIGALYTAHERITKQYLKKAAAVIFIMDPQNPLTEPEVNFVDWALGITGQIMFIMTKMDNYDQDYIQQIVTRNEEILFPFENRILNNSVKVYPMSSIRLQEAAKEDIDILKEDLWLQSRFDTVKDEMLRLIHTTVGLSRNVYAFNVFNSYNSVVMSSIAEQTKALSSPGSAKELLEQKDMLKNRFVHEWGSNGEKQKEIIQQVNDQITALRNQAATLFNKTGPIYEMFDREIETLTLKEAEEYGKKLPSRLADEFGHTWKSLLANCQDGICMILQKYNQEIAEQVADNINMENVESHIKPFQFKNMDFMQYFNHYRNGFFSAVFASTLLGLASIPVAGWLLLPIGSIIAILTGNKERLNKYKNELRTYLSDNIMSIYQSFCVTPISIEEPISILQKTEREIGLGAKEVLKKIYEEQKSNVEKELAVLTEQIQKEGEERKLALQHIGELRVTWNVIYQELLETKVLIEQVENEIFEKDNE